MTGRGPHSPHPCSSMRFRWRAAGMTLEVGLLRQLGADSSDTSNISLPLDTLIFFQVIHPGDNIRANETSQKWTRPGMPPDSGGITRGCPLLGGAVCPNVVSRVGYVSLKDADRAAGIHRSVERPVVYCRAISASTAPCTSRRMCCLTHCASYCASCPPLSRAFTGQYIYVYAQWYTYIDPYVD